MYILKITHFNSCNENGKLSSKSVINDILYFRTKESAIKSLNERIHQCAKRKSEPVIKNSVLYKNSKILFTGKKWIEEDTGEQRSECYTFTVEKANAN